MAHRGKNGAKIGYYPGCALHGTSREYDISVRKVNEVLGVDMREIEDWSCCGASSAHMTNYKLNIALNTRNLVLAERQGFEQVLAPCPLCSKALLETAHELAEQKELAAEMTDTIGEPFRGSVRTINYLQMVEQHLLERLEEKIVKKFEGVRVACYYGCLLTRPPEIVQFDDHEQPSIMDRIVEKTGVEPVDWSFKTECCGAGFTISLTDVVVNLCNKILKNAKASGADAVIAACPMCHANLDMRQLDIASRLGVKHNMPIVYLSELLGIALGLTPHELGLDKHFIPTNAIISKAHPVK
jgi:heterodisulfide reductase subunit B